jgi:hypothetical protein
MADSTITGLTAILGANVAAGDFFVLDDTDAAATKKILASELIAYILGARTIGGTTAGDIADINSAQTFTNKTLTAPLLNEAVALTATSSELNKLDAVTAVAADFNAIAGIAALGIAPAEIGYLNGVTSAIQTQINTLNAAISTTAKVYCYSVEWDNNAAATKAITEATINTACAVPTGYFVDHTTINGILYTRVDNAYTQVAWDGSVKLSSTRTNIGGGVNGLGTLTINGLTNDSTTDYAFAITFKVLAAGA